MPLFVAEASWKYNHRHNKDAFGSFVQGCFACDKLFYGDCLTVMESMKLGSVDLIYLDPPFNSNREYNVIYKDETGRPLPDQIEAFCDL